MGTEELDIRPLTEEEAARFKKEEERKRREERRQRRERADERPRSRPGTVTMSIYERDDIFFYGAIAGSVLSILLAALIHEGRLSENDAELAQCEAMK